jgi:murein DD-endopeptidase MepM/ murein hydrolase activator NlpD
LRHDFYTLLGTFSCLAVGFSAAGSTLSFAKSAQVQSAEAPQTNPPAAAQAAQDAHTRQAVLTAPRTLGALVVGQAPEGIIAVDLDGVGLALNENRQFAFGLPREAAEVVVLTLKHADGQETRQFLSVEGRPFGRQDIVGLPPATITLPPDLLARREEERARITAARQTRHALEAWAKPFIWPTYGRLTSPYGVARTRNGQPGQPHWGVDIANAVGTPIVAPADGVVTLAEPDLLLEGGVIILDHGNGVFTDYQHLSALTVTVGTAVVQGQQIGLMGNTGRSTAAHLHWGLTWRANPETPLVRLDPSLLPGLGALPKEALPAGALPAGALPAEALPAAQ